MNDVTLFADYGARRFTSQEGGTFETQTFTVGDKVTFGLKVQDRTDTETKDKDLHIRTIRASVGKVVTPPLEGACKIWIGDTNIDDITPAMTAAELHAKLVSSGVVPEVGYVTLIAPAYWQVRTTLTELTSPIYEGEEARTLYPESFVRIKKYMRSGQVWFDLWLVQQPLAFTGAFERILPDAPSIEPVRDGAPRDPGSTANTNEVQALKVPVDFVGTFYLKFDYRTTKLLGVQDGPDEIAAALNAMYSDGKTRFEVTNPENEKAYIEFVGDLGSTDLPLIEVQVHSFEPGIPSFMLDFGKEQMRLAMRGIALVKDVPFEVEIEVVDSAEDLENPAVEGRVLTFAMTCAIVNEQITEELAEVPAINWLRPPSPKDYIPFTPDQVITGVQHYLAVRGDGEATEFPLDHGLATDEIASVVVRENVSNGKLLKQGADYDVVINNDDTVTVSVPIGGPAPAANAWAIIITAAGPKSAFQAHTHTIGQIIGLQDILDGFAARLSSIEDRLPFTDPADPDETTSTPYEIEIPDKFIMFPGRYEDGFDFKSGKPLKRPPALVPAVHDATVVDWSDPDTLPDLALPANKNQVWRFVPVNYEKALRPGEFVYQFGSANNTYPGSDLPPVAMAWLTSGFTRDAVVVVATLGDTSVSLNFFSEEGILLSYSGGDGTFASGESGDLIIATVGTLTIGPLPASWFIESATAIFTIRKTDIQMMIPGGLGHRARFIGHDQFFATDGRIFYQVSRDGTTNSYFPTDAEFEQFLLFINSSMLRPGQALTVEFELALQMLAATSRTQVLLNIEVGEATQDTTPATTGVNLKDVVWNTDDPLMSLRLLVGPVKQKHKLGVSIGRLITNEMVANILTYNLWTAAPADSKPATANFVLRARVMQFDTENSVRDAKGTVWTSLTDATAEIK